MDAITRRRFLISSGVAGGAALDRQTRHRLGERGAGLERRQLGGRAVGEGIARRAGGQVRVRHRRAPVDLAQHRVEAVPDHRLGGDAH